MRAHIQIVQAKNEKRKKAEGPLTNAPTVQPDPTVLPEEDMPTQSLATDADITHAISVLQST